jgi:hypothetical protein
VRDTTGAVDCATRVPGRPPIIRLLAVRTLGAHPSSSIVPPSDVEGVPLAQQYSRPLYTVPPPQVPVYLQHCRCNKKGKCKNCKDGYKKENVGYGYAMYKKCVYNELPEGMTGSKNWPAKKTYGKYEKGAPSCDPNSDYTALSAGLCYKEPKNNYECQLTACQQKCASGTVEWCGGVRGRPAAVRSRHHGYGRSSSTGDRERLHIRRGRQCVRLHSFCPAIHDAFT